MLPFTSYCMMMENKQKKKEKIRNRIKADIFKRLLIYNYKFTDNPKYSIKDYEIFKNGSIASSLQSTFTQKEKVMNDLKFFTEKIGPNVNYGTVINIHRAFDEGDNFYCRRAKKKYDKIERKRYTLKRDIYLEETYSPEGKGYIRAKDEFLKISKN